MVESEPSAASGREPSAREVLSRLAEASHELRAITGRDELFERATRTLRAVLGDGVVLARGAHGEALLTIVAGEERWSLVSPKGELPRAVDLDAAATLAAIVEAQLLRLAASDHAASGARSHRMGSGRARATFDDLRGEDRGFLDCLEMARRAAASDLPILITGETGTGKELLAQAIHGASPRRSRPFVGINVAAIPRELLESELFGYERGAFTGARASGKAGLFELAADGTLLLDEIGDMPVDLQVKLLRVLQERVVQPVGGAREIPVRARIISTTHRDVREATRTGAFRADLYYRLRGVHIRVPALRERLGDIPLLLDDCLARFGARHGRPPPRVSPRVLAAYLEHDWPGNIRELMHLVEAEASVLPPGEDVITRLPTTRRRAPVEAPPAHDDPPPGSWRPPVGAIDELERRAYQDTLHRVGGNVSEAARLLGVSRGTLYNKMRRYGLEPRESTPPPPSIRK